MFNTDTPPEIDDTCCPLSGLPILRRSEWTDLAFEPNYRFSTALMGDRIIYNQPVGNATAASLEKALSLTDEVCEELIPEAQTYVHLSDYRRVKGVSMGGRKYFVNYMLTRTRIAGFIIFGASPLMRIIIKLGQKIGRSKDSPVFEVHTYAQAMDKALELLGQTAVAEETAGDEKACRQDTHEVRQRFEKGRLVLSAPHWHIDNDGFSMQAEVIDHQILHSTVTGLMRSRHCDLIDAMRHCIRSEAGLEAGFPYFITCTKGLKQNSRRTRQRYMQALKTWHLQYPIRLYVFYGASRLIKAAVSLARPFMPFKIRIVSDRDAALRLVEADRRNPSRLQRIRYRFDHSKRRRQREIEGYRDELLHYLGDIDWERDGLQNPPSHGPDHPMGPVFEAITLLKTELDQVFNERHAMADALGQSQQRFNEVMTHSRDLLFKHDIETGAYAYVSDSAKALIGYTPEEIQTMGADGILELMHPEDRQRYHAFCQSLLGNGDQLPQEHVIEYRIRHKDGRYVWFSDSHAVLRDEAGRPTQVIGSNRDIQRSKAMEAERLRMAKRLQRSGKLEAVSTLAGGIAHNFNNLLMTILGNVEMARMQLDADSHINPRIDAIQKAADRAAELSTLMLTYVGQSKMSFDTLDLGALVGEMVRVLKATLPHADQLEKAAEGETAYVSGDPGKIGQVITDVVTNAVEATTDEARKITLQTGLRQCDTIFFERRAAYEQLPSGEYAYVEVKDNGVGMDAQTLEKVFDPFFTTKFTGRGLGLAASVGIMRAHQGAMVLASHPNQGTTVTILFPPVAAPAAARPMSRTGTHPYSHGGAEACNTVLLVDDEPMVLEVGEMMLEAIGFDILTAADGIGALEQFKSHREEIALVILDLTMPRMDGFETFHKIIKIAPDTPIIIATGYTRGQVRQQFREQEPSAYLKKPFRMDHLADTIRRVLMNPQE